MFGWVRLKDEAIVLSKLFRRTEIALDDLQSVLYHYHAVAGYVFLWEFCARNGRTLEVDLCTFGRSCLLLNLETHLPGFSLKVFKQLFEKGDVVDTLEVWKRKVPIKSEESTG